MRARPSPAPQVGNAPDSNVIPVVAALPSGGFVIAWANATTNAYEMQAFTAAGVADGAVVTVNSGVSGLIDLDVTADGRVLVTLRDSEIVASIWDPRSDVIDMADFNRGQANVLETNTVFSRAAGTTVIGTGDADTIFGGGAADLLQAAGGADVLDGGSGNDTLEGGAGNDTLIAGFGSDTFDGGADTDTVDISRGRFNGVICDFDIDLDAGEDGFGNEYISIENIIGGEGDDDFVGTGAANTLIGGGGNDTIEGGFGGDSLDGGAGDNDTLSYASSGRVIVNLCQNIFLLGDAAGDTVTGFENVIGSDVNDNLIGDANDNSMFGGGGGDAFGSSGGVDAYFGGTGNDTFQILASEAEPGSTYDGGDNTDTLIPNGAMSDSL